MPWLVLADRLLDLLGYYKLPQGSYLSDAQKKYLLLSQKAYLDLVVLGTLLVGKKDQKQGLALHLVDYLAENTALRRKY